MTEHIYIIENDDAPNFTITVMNSKTHVYYRNADKVIEAGDVVEVEDLSGEWLVIDTLDAWRMNPIQIQRKNVSLIMRRISFETRLIGPRSLSFIRRQEETT